MNAADASNYGYTIAIIVVAFISSVVGPAVLLLLGRSRGKKKDEDESKDAVRPLENEAIALILRMEARVQQAEAGRTDAESRVERWRGYAKVLRQHIIRLGGTPERHPEEDE